jgi:hypothetical protein
VSGNFNDRPLWTPRRDALIFISDRGGSFGLWSIPVSGERAAGAAVPVRTQIGNVMLQGITPARVLYYTQNTGIRQVFVMAHTIATLTLWTGGSDSNRQSHFSPPSLPIQS